MKTRESFSKNGIDFEMIKGVTTKAISCPIVFVKISAPTNLIRIFKEIVMEPLLSFHDAISSFFAIASKPGIILDIDGPEWFKAIWTKALKTYTGREKRYEFIAFNDDEGKAIVVEPGSYSNILDIISFTIED